MVYLSVAGLFLDLIGVLLLGVDLMRVQRKLQREAEERLSALSEVVESTGSLDKFLKSISGDWREYERDEGTYVPRVGTFDDESAKRSFDEMKDGINGLADDLRAVVTMMVATVEGDQKTAGMSLNVSYTGLMLVVVGFLLQILAHL